MLLDYTLTATIELFLICSDIVYAYSQGKQVKTLNEVLPDEQETLLDLTNGNWKYCCKT